MNNLYEFARMIFVAVQSIFYGFQRIVFTINLADNISFDVSLFEIIVSFIAIDFVFFIFYHRSMGRE